ncbi:hypothetical protein SASPL_104031 [Salvia splendens]|uniref:Uncharacterized protein n=1 Tax=Salvia splendens TaxID=180675 RepID=A0A8X8YM08_SALSN|nr:hypothetical protein SASPL_104031 [Salvia splendens]
MAGGGNFIHRVLSYVANELIVNGLANNLSFQRFAVRTSRKMNEISEIAAQKKKELAEQVKDASKNFGVAQGPVMVEDRSAETVWELLYSALGLGEEIVGEW